MQVLKETDLERSVSPPEGWYRFRQIIYFELIVTFSRIELILLLHQIIEKLDLK